MAYAIACSVRSIQEPVRVLDLGCGDGKMARMGLQTVTCEAYHGIDLSATALNSAKDNLRALAKELEFTESDIVKASERIASLCVNKLASPANLVLASYSLHHLAEAEILKTLCSVRSAMSDRGCFCWIDLCMRPGETRRDYLDRFYKDELGQWPSLTESEVPQVRQHMETSDYPLSASRMVELATDAKLSFCEVLYQDDCYVAIRFAAG